MVKNPANPIIWALLDDKIGHQNHVLGVVEALKLPTIEKHLSYTPLSNLHNALKINGFVGLSADSKAQLRAPWPDIIIAAGRKTAPIARQIKKCSGGKTKLVQLLWPPCPKDIDLIITPKHDNPPNWLNVISLPCMPHRISKKTLSAAKKHWAKHFEPLKKPLISVLIGGSVKGQEMTEAHAFDLIDILKSTLEITYGSLYISTSRRTPDNIVDELRRRYGAHKDVRLYTDMIGTENPYIGMLAHADAHIVTGDSVAMISEACSTGKPVGIFAPQGFLPAKHQRFVDKLTQEKYAHNITPKSAIKFAKQANHPQNHPVLKNPAAEIAKLIKQQLLT